MKPFQPPSAAAVQEIRRLSERHLSAEEREAYEQSPITPEERENTLELIDWFLRRYPTPLERLAYARRAARRWKKACP